MIQLFIQFEASCAAKFRWCGSLLPASVTACHCARLRSDWLKACPTIFAMWSVAIVFVAAFATPVFADGGDESARKSLERQSFPWYDAETGKVKPIELLARDGAKSGERNQIPKHQPAPVRNSSWNWNWDFPVLDFFSWLLLVLGIGVLVAAGVWAWRNVDVRSQRDFQAEQEPTRTRAESISQLPFSLDSTEGDFRSLAASAYQTGDFRQAIVFLFSHVLVSLDQNHLIHLKKGKTNRQYLRELASHRDLAQYYEEVMLPFEASFFGDHDLAGSEFALCWNQLDRFQTKVAAVAERNSR